MTVRALRRSTEPGLQATHARVRSRARRLFGVARATRALPVVLA